MKKYWLIIAFLLILVFWFSWFFRYSIQINPKGYPAYKLDRWTNKITLILHKTEFEVKLYKEPEILSTEEFLGKPKKDTPAKPDLEFLPDKPKDTPAKDK